MALADILQKIREDAEKEAAGHLNAARTTVRQIEEQSSQVETTIEQEERVRGKQKQNALKRKAANMISHQKKAALLDTKQSVLTDIFHEAEEKLVQLSDAEQKKIFISMLKTISAPSGTLRPTKESITSLKEAVSESKSPFTLGEEISGKGGFVFVSDEMEMDFRFDTLLKTETKKALEQELSQILFS